MKYINCLRCDFSFLFSKFIPINQLVINLEQTSLWNLILHSHTHQHSLHTTKECYYNTSILLGKKLHSPYYQVRYFLEAQMFYFTLSLIFNSLILFLFSYKMKTVVIYSQRLLEAFNEQIWTTLIFLSFRTRNMLEN